MEINLEQLHGEEDFLRLLVRLGQEAERRIQAKDIGDKISWDSLPDLFFRTCRRPVSPVSRLDYERWLRNLKVWSRSRHLNAPKELSAPQAANAAEDLLGRNVSRERIIRFYRRVWKAMGWDETIWSSAASSEIRAKEYYRRLRQYEVCRLVGYLDGKDTVLRDMVIIGYYTGLRLSDVAELERREIDFSRRALKIVPNKVKTRKPRALVIPLVREAWDVVSMRRSATFLFPESARIRPSRLLSSAFRHCKIKKEGFGRASFHSLRATFISLMDEAGIQPYITDAITGHASGSMHARYTQPDLRTLRAAVLKAIKPLGIDLQEYTVRDASALGVHGH